MHKPDFHKYAKWKRQGKEACCVLLVDLLHNTGTHLLQIAAFAHTRQLQALMSVDRFATDSDVQLANVD